MCNNFSCHFAYTYACIKECLKFFSDFTLTGQPAPRNLSAKDRARIDEQKILEDLRNEGLIATSTFEARSGMAFEVVEASDQLQLRRAPPARLAKLNKKKKKEKTKEEIAAKLERAEKRRKVSQKLYYMILEVCQPFLIYMYMYAYTYAIFL